MPTTILGNNLLSFVSPFPILTLGHLLNGVAKKLIPYEKLRDAAGITESDVKDIIRMQKGLGTNRLKDIKVRVVLFFDMIMRSDGSHSGASWREIQLRAN